MSSKQKLTVGVLCLEPFRFLHDHGEHDDFGLLLGGGMQQPVVPVGRHVEHALRLKVHLLFVVCKLCQAPAAISNDRGPAR